ncbi:Non-reducing polyketide synthase ascC like protein [Verticillium longisporum]|uniref:Non-reducing polyketide synthase ascC like protein n=1 Tax=Verticillium longisporum TaxID=100787 RepID=A0A8I2ZVU2_VERLO|nr:Non-reducing polyketide synthase ascC like protein [Verticillium longisporum]
MEPRYTLEPSIHGHDEMPSNNTMAKPSSFRAVYKIEDSQEIDVDVSLDLDHVFSFGTSSGGTLALALGFGVPRPVAGIFDMYGPCNFPDPFWTSELAHVAAKLPKNLTEDFMNKVYDERPVPIVGGVSLEGRAQGPPDFSDPRPAFAMTQIASGNVLGAIYPSKDWKSVDPLLNVNQDFPPTYIAHGAADTMVPIDLSRDLLRALEEHGIKSGMCEIPGEEHTFAAKMQVGSQTWDLQRRGFDFLQNLI